MQVFLRSDTSLFPQERFLQGADVRDWSPLLADLISSHETTDLSSNKGLVVSACAHPNPNHAKGQCGCTEKNWPAERFQTTF